MVYKAVHFADYSVEERYGNEWVMPAFPSPFDSMEHGKNAKLTGQELLVSLCNLFHEMNDPEGNVDRYKKIVEWCVDNIHPYDIDALCITAEEMEPGTEQSTAMQMEGRFDPKDFINDLCRLGTTFDFAYALTEIKENGNVTPARELYYEGRLCDGLPFFETYRWIDDDEEYREKVMNEYDKHTETLIDILPDFRMRLKLDRESGKVMYGADVQSVFDICWYTLSRIIADVAPPADQDMDYMYSQGKILSCLACGSFFVRHSSRQLYCDNPNCQAERNRRNRRASYARKKAAEVPKKTRNTTKKT